MTDLFIFSLGSNLGDRMSNLQYARKRLEEEIGQVNAASSILENAAFGVSDHPPYLNQVLCLQSVLDPLKVLEITEKIESEAGRGEKGLLMPRTLDIDIIAAGNRVIIQSSLIIPHKSMHLRRFVLEPLCEILPGWEHPIMQKNASQLLLELMSSEFRTNIQD
jgi:2-amino-4-hydroxy-6-hydroxymethyldihydropteridine diphosphokinase